MRSTSSEEILSEAFSARIEVVDALRAASDATGLDARRLRMASDQLSLIASLYGGAPNAAIYGALADLAYVVALLGDWRAAVLSAEKDSQRFLIAAKERGAVWIAAQDTNPALKNLRAIADQVSKIDSIGDVAPLAAKLIRVPLPIGIFTRPGRESLRTAAQTQEVETGKHAPELTVAFVKFSVDGKPLEQVHYVSPGEVHDLDIEVRVARWPKGASHLVLDPMTVEPAGTYQLPGFKLEAPLGESGPYRLKSGGRAVITVPNHVHARPYEFKYAARFDPPDSEQPVEVTGQRTLLLEGIDFARHPLTGYPSIDNNLVNVRNALRASPNVSQKELADALKIAVALGNYAGQVVQDNLYRSAIGEGEFQRELKKFLRSLPQIGSELEEHPRSAGGITDLSFRGIRIELKSEPNEALNLGDCQRFVGQAASYTVGSGKHVGILCVLDCSKKKRAPFPVEDGIGFFRLQDADGSPVYILAFLLQGNLEKPSSLSH